MELPKNITQIGETNQYCKIYVEDYVFSYMKQLNQFAQDKNIGVALYGSRKEEAGVSYLFLYGACKLDFLQRESRHLSQAVLQEAEKQRRKHFPGCDFLGYRMLNGEMIEGFHVYEQGTCRYIEGYARFYEKNDSMLAFMLEERQEEAKPEEFDQNKYDEVKKRQEERRAAAAERSAHTSVFREKQQKQPGQQAVKKDNNMAKMRLAAAAAFLVLCIAGLAAMGGGEKLEDLQLAAKRLVDEFAQKQLPDAMEANGPAQVGSIVTEDKLTDAILKENQTASNTKAPVPGATTAPTALPTTAPTAIPTSAPTPALTANPTAVPTPVPTAKPTAAPTPVPTAAPTAAPVSYTIKKGDTLIGICIKRYGSDARVAEICELNHIENPDDIKVDDKILLP